MQKRNQNILITGATSGIGEALALHYAATTAKTLFICGRNEDRLLIVQKKCEKLGTLVFAKILDVKDKEAVSNWLEECEQNAPLNLVIANAGVATLEETPENIRNTFDTNVGGVINTVVPTIEIYKKRQYDLMKKLSGNNSSLEQFIHNMKKQKRAFSMNPFRKKFLGDIGCELYHNDQKAIAIVSSIAGYHGMATCPSYSASKACVKAWGEALRIDLKRRYNINVSVICPGFVRSGITDKNTCPMPFFMEADKAAAIIAKRLNKNVGLIAFPWPMRFASWFGSVLPNKISEFIYSHLPYKV
ncbi:MAG: SDR family NAD(P)-dependent oxidoreductase [Alphaproteobacteria bacterium]|nr:SDR family NAD(P)-dependent oxidoreductase [Alphaproteobacteria bacterium]